MIDALPENIREIIDKIEDYKDKAVAVHLYTQGYYNGYSDSLEALNKKHNEENELQ